MGYSVLECGQVIITLVDAHIGPLAEGDAIDDVIGPFDTVELADDWALAHGLARYTVEPLNRPF